MSAGGGGPGDRFATLAASCLEFRGSCLASASVGAIWVGLNPRYADPELDALIGHMAPKLVFAAGAIERRDYRSWLQGLPNAVAVVGLDAAMPARADRFERFLARGGAGGRARVEARGPRVERHDPVQL